MRAEIAKTRYLPTPRWIAAASIGLCIVVGVVLFFVAPKNSDRYVTVSSVAVEFALSVPIIVFGVWIIAVEFAAGTLQRTLTAESNRNRVLGAKLLVALIVAAAVSVAAAAASGGLATLAGDRAGIPVDQSDLARAVFAAVPGGIAYVVIGFAFGLVTRSMGGGIALGAMFAFVLDGFLSFIPGIRDIAYGRFSGDVTNHLSGTGDTDHPLALAAIGVLAWLIVLTVPGWLMFTRGDLK